MKKITKTEEKRLVVEYKRHFLNRDTDTCDLCKRKYEVRFITSDINKILAEKLATQHRDLDPDHIFHYREGDYLKLCFGCVEKYADDDTPIHNYWSTEILKKKDLKEKSEFYSEYYVNLPQYTDIITLFKHNPSNMSKTRTYSFYNGLNRPKFLLSFVDSYVIPDSGNQTPIDMMIEFRYDPYDHIRTQLGIK